MLLAQLLNLLINDPVQFLVAIMMLIVPLLISITFHEWSHGYVAYKFGDPTPKLFGRLTLNPFAHLDPLGTLMLFIIGIGWAKPVPINTLNIESRTKQMLVALAGPLSNLLLAIVFTLVSVCISLFYKGPVTDIIALMHITVTVVIKINLILAIFNMLPIPPFDGSRVLAWMMPDRLAEKYLSLEPYGIAIAFLILFTFGFKFVLYAADFVQSKMFEIIKIFISNTFL